MLLVHGSLAVASVAYKTRSADHSSDADTDGPLPTPRSASATMSNDAEFILTGPRHPVAPSDQVMIRIILRNRAAKARYFNARFNVAPLRGEVTPTVLDPSGTDVPFNSRIKMAPPLSIDFVLLQPDEVVQGGFPLRYYYNLKTPGTYVVSATYQAKEIPVDLAKLDVFTGELEAQAIRVVIS
jgi:hypothetical protein